MIYSPVHLDTRHSVSEDSLKLTARRPKSTIFDMSSEERTIFDVSSEERVA
jgi:hypothetical protein